MLFQLFYYPYLMRRAWKVKGISNKISVFLKGPGWAPGKPRLGYIEEIPDVRIYVFHSIDLSMSMYVYTYMYMCRGNIIA